MLSVQPGLRGNKDLRVGRNTATFQLFFQSGRAKDLSAPLYASSLPYFNIILSLTSRSLRDTLCPSLPAKLPYNS